MPNPSPSQNNRENNDLSESEFNQLLFEQELNEIYLLLDFISGRQDKHLSELAGKIPRRGTSDSDDRWMSPDEIVQFISTLRYPPGGDLHKRSEDAATLLLVKDALNSIAYPARGMTIAYTTLFADTTGMTKGRPVLAKLAYPSLVNHAKWFRRFNTGLVALALGFTMLAAGLLWHLTYGVQLTARFEEAKRNDTASFAKVFDQLNSLNVSGAKMQYNILSTCHLREDDGPPLSMDVSQHQAIYGGKDHDASSSTGADGHSVFKTETSAIQLACSDYAFKHAQLCVTIADFSIYARSFVFAIIGKILPIHKSEKSEACDLYPTLKREKSDVSYTAGFQHNGIPAAKDDTAWLGKKLDGEWTARSAHNLAVAEKGGAQNHEIGRQEDAVSIAGVLQVTSNSLLPILFGLCGSLVSHIRNIQNKIYANLLIPKDRALTVIRIPLGLVAGVCVGLFFSPDGSARSASGFGGFTLTASGIAFLAGYGAEAFFKMLDAAVDRIFVLSDTAKAKT